jgi:hypothetical protein
MKMRDMDVLRLHWYSMQRSLRVVTREIRRRVAEHVTYGVAEMRREQAAIQAEQRAIAGK